MKLNKVILLFCPPWPHQLILYCVLEFCWVDFKCSHHIHIQTHTVCNYVRWYMWWMTRLWKSFHNVYIHQVITSYASIYKILFVHYTSLRKLGKKLVQLVNRSQAQVYFTRYIINGFSGLPGNSQHPLHFPGPSLSLFSEVFLLWAL